MDSDTFLTTGKEGRALSLDELSEIVNRFSADSKKIACQFRVGDGVMLAIEKRFPPVKNCRFEFGILGVPICTDPTIPPGELRVLNSSGEVIQTITGISTQPTTTE